VNDGRFLPLIRFLLLAEDRNVFLLTFGKQLSSAAVRYAAVGALHGALEYASKASISLILLL